MVSPAAVRSLPALSRTRSAAFFSLFTLTLLCLVWNSIAQAEDQSWEAEVLVEEDFVRPPHKIIRFRNDFSGQGIELEIDEKASEYQRELAEFLQTGDKVNLQFRRWPRAARSRMKLSDRLSDDNEVSIASVEPAVSENLLSASGVTGTRQIIAFRIKYRNWGSAVSESAIDNALFKASDSNDSVYRRTSYGAIRFDGDLNNDGRTDIYYFEVSKPSNPCDYTTVASQVDQLARNQNINLGSYHHRAYFLPPEVSCGWAGVAYIGCPSSCQSFYDSSYISSFWNDLVPHELGHNLGMRHSSMDANDDGNIDSGATYTDHSCFMGNPSNVVENNLPHRYQLGLIGDSDIRDVSGSATHTLASLDTSPSQTALPLGIRLRIGSTSSKYYIAYRRRRSGTFDMNLKSSYYNRVSIHRWSSSNTMLVGTLSVGQSRTLSNGDRVTFTSSNGSSAVVAINGGGTPPSPSPSPRPSASSSPRPSASSSPRPSSTPKVDASSSPRPSVSPSPRPSSPPKGRRLGVKKMKVRVKLRKKKFLVKVSAQIVDEQKKGVPGAQVVFAWNVKTPRGFVRMSQIETVPTRGRGGRAKLRYRIRRTKSKIFPESSDKVTVEVRDVQKAGYAFDSSSVETFTNRLR